jgi:hemoglobin-like flavoprotein
MTPDDVALVQLSWQKVVPIKEKAAELFYGRLFELDPTLRPLFKGDMVVQGGKLTTMLNAVITGLNNLDAIVPAAQALAKRHVAYGVKPAHYQTVGAALIWTLKQGLGKGFTPETEAAWGRTYGVLSSTMIAAAA